MTWNGFAHERQKVTAIASRAAPTSASPVDDRRVHAVTRFDVAAARDDDVELEGLHAST